jgi:hypothetical protein
VSVSLISSQRIVEAMSAAVAPVFLISAVGLLLTAMNVRFGRVIDRMRIVLREQTSGDVVKRSADLDAELRALYARARTLRLTVILAIASIFAIAICIFLIFSDLIWGVSLPLVIPTIFSIGLVLLLASLGFFIEDFAISLNTIKREVKVALGRDVIGAGVPPDGTDAPQHPRSSSQQPDRSS